MGSVLITGDVEARGEEALLRSAELASDVVVVPHHGSNTSSSPSLVAATQARYALVSAGYGNRWGFPKPAVRARWAASGAKVAVTADGGALTVTLAERGVSLTAERDAHRHYWQAADSTLP
jgi:competence protein ComEC